ncbi:MAG: hypothetical protein HC869_04200 [Rhodospirillales bacterium]|nr:hypothetical protein [Rhodospirillales bacterium]
MSIQDELKACVAKKRLVPFAPSPPISVYRPVFLVPSVNDQVVGPWDNRSDDSLSMPFVRADLEHFIMGAFVTAAFGRKPKAGFRRLSQKKRGIPIVWEMRITASKVQYRIIGMFPERDVFIGAEMWCRDLINFEEEIDKATSLWEGWFPGFSPVRSDNIHDYISENVVLLRQ